MSATGEPTANATRQAAVPWLFSPVVDVACFGGSAALALLLVVVAGGAGWLDRDAPEWTWVLAILLVDVAHVWGTAFRVYFVPDELRRRPWLYGLTPVLGWLLGAAVYSESSAWFWRCLAYLAVAHFVRQQVGWVALYRAKAGGNAQGDRWLDEGAIYAATLWPLVWWHGHLPRRFWWFIPGDFAALPAAFATWTEPLYWGLLAAYAVRALVRWQRGEPGNPGRDLVVGTTALCWYVGMVALNSDVAFTVTNVLIHGIPYIVLVGWVGLETTGALSGPSPHKTTAVGERQTDWGRWSAYVATLWVLAYVEEFCWEHAIWGERPWLFGSFPAVEEAAAEWRTVVVPLLAVPQWTHYILDGFIWKRRSNPRVGRFIG